MIAFLFLILLVLLGLARIIQVEKIKSKVPHLRPCWPIIGNLLRILTWSQTVNEAVNSIEREAYEQFGKLGHFVLFLGLQPLVYVLSGDLLQRVLKNPAIVDKSSEYNAMRDWLGDGLITSNGETWRKHRKLLNPVFNSKLIKGFIPTINAEAILLVNCLKETCSNDWIDIRDMIRDFGLRVITGTILGARFTDDLQKNVYVKCIEDYNKLAIARAFNPFLTSDLVYSMTTSSGKSKQIAKYLHQFTINLLRKADDSDTSNNTLLSALHRGKVESGFTEKDIREELDTFLFAGHDTSNSALMWLLALIGYDKRVQEKIYEELCSLLTDNQDITTENLNKLNYLECTIKEGLRLHPPVPRVARISRAPVTIDDFTFKEGTTFMIPLHCVHRNEMAFERPNEFIPERFLNMTEDAQQSFAPFAAGPRGCIGQVFAMIEVKIVLAHILRSFELTALDNPSSIAEPLGVTNQPESPIRIRFSERH